MLKFNYDYLENGDGSNVLSCFTIDLERCQDRRLRIMSGGNMSGIGYFVLKDLSAPIDLLFSAPYVPMILHGSRVYEDSYITEDGDKVMFIMFSTKDNTLVIVRVSTDKSEDDLLNMKRDDLVYSVGECYFNSIVSAIEIKREALDSRYEHSLGKAVTQWIFKECGGLGNVSWDSIYSTFIDYTKTDIELFNLFGMVDYAIARKTGILVSSEDYSEDSGEVMYELDEFDFQNVDDIYEFSNSLMPDGFRCLNVEMLEKISDAYDIIYGNESEDEGERFRVSAFDILSEVDEDYK